MEAPHSATLEASIDRLRKSPLFNLSLASKELFHSNFLAWLCEGYPDLVGPLFGRFTKALCPSYDGLKVHRELHNIDLTIDFPNHERLIVENKVKSIASKEQLEKYSDQEQDQHTAFLLLSVTRPAFFPSDDHVFCAVGGAAWRFLSYKDLVAQLEPIIESISARDKYHGELIKDYVGFLTSLVAIASHVSVNWEDEEEQFFRPEEVQMLRKIRLHDLMDKIRYAQLVERIENRLLADGILADGFHVLTRNDVEHGARGGDWAIYPAFYQGEATCEFKYVVRGGNKPVFLAVLLQGNKIKVFAGVPNDPEAAESVANSLLSPTAGGKLWFDLDKVGGSPERPATGFNKYDGKWLYRYKKIDRCSPRGLVDIFVAYAHAIRDDQEAIRSQIEATYESDESDDVQQAIPLSARVDYQAHIREKKQKGRKHQAEGYGLRQKFWQGLLTRAVGKTSLHANKSPGERGGIHAKSALRGVSFAYNVHRDEGEVGLYIDAGTQEENKRIYDSLQSHQAEIDAAFDGGLSWRRLDHRRASRVVYMAPGGLRSDESQWPSIQDAMIDAMVRLEKAISPHLAELKTEA